MSDSLSEDSLELTSSSEVSSEALAKTFGVITDSSSGAVSSLSVSRSQKNISTRWAFLKGAIWSSESSIAQASNMFRRIPNGGISGERSGSSVGKEVFSDAKSSSTAIIWADGSLTSHTLVVIETGALSGLSVADSLVGALNRWMSLVKGGGGGNPSVTLWASS